MKYWSISNSIYNVVYKVVAPVVLTACLVITLLPLYTSDTGQAEKSITKSRTPLTSWSPLSCTSLSLVFAATALGAVNPVIAPFQSRVCVSAVSILPVSAVSPMPPRSVVQATRNPPRQKAAAPLLPKPPQTKSGEHPTPPHSLLP